MVLKAKPYGEPERSLVLVIGSDPRLRDSDTVASYCLFADYFFKPLPRRSSEAAKYDLAASVFNQIAYLTSNMVDPVEILVSNLCNEALPHAPKGKTVLIPETAAIEGVRELRELLVDSSVQIIFAMSEQVNYWFQNLGFCSADSEFIDRAAPARHGLDHDPPYYQHTHSSAFQLICGKQFEGPNGIYLFPILHAKAWPLKDNFARVYNEAYDQCRETVKPILKGN